MEEAIAESRRLANRLSSLPKGAAAALEALGLSAGVAARLVLPVSTPATERLRTELADALRGLSLALVQHAEANARADQPSPAASSLAAVQTMVARLAELGRASMPAEVPFARGTHSVCSAVRLPRLDGMVPLSGLLSRSLRAWRGGSQRPEGAAQCRRHAQQCQRSQAAQAGRDGAAQLVAGKGSAHMVWWLSAPSGSGAVQQARTVPASQSGCPGWTGWCRSAGCLGGVCAHGVVALSAQRERSRAAGTHRSVSAVRLPMLVGMVPLSWLL